MNLFHQIQNYKPMNQQEECDKELMLQFMTNNSNYLERENKIAHFTASVWTVNKERTKTLMAYQKRMLCTQSFAFQCHLSGRG